METCARAEFLASHSVYGTPMQHSTKAEGNLDSSHQSNQEFVVASDTERELGMDSSEQLIVHEPQAPCPVSKEQENNLPESTPWWHQHMFNRATRPQEQITSKKQRLRVVQPADSLLPSIRNRKFEMPELCRVFMGEVWRIMFTIAACCDLYGLTWSIAAVSASSLASDIPILHNQNDYMLFVLIFAVIVIPVSFLSVADQIWIQMVFFGGRMVMVILMLVTVAVAFGASKPHFGDQDGPQPTSPLANFSMLSL